MEHDDFSIAIARSNISITRKLLRIGYAILLVILGVFALNIYNLCSGISHIDWLTGIGIGVSGTTSFSIWISMWEAKLDLRLEKEKLFYLEQRVEKNAVI